MELVDKETLVKEDLERILAPVRKRPPHNAFNGFGKRTPSDRPPIEIPAGAARKHWRLRGLNTVLLFNAAKTAKKAHKENISLKQACVALGFLTEEKFDEVFHPEQMA
mgnify:CR=1 FL=1